MRDLFYEFPCHFVILNSDVSIHKAVTLLIGLSIVHMHTLRQFDKSRKIAVAHFVLLESRLHALGERNVGVIACQCLNADKRIFVALA